MSERSWVDFAPLRRGEVWVKKHGEETAVYDEESGGLYALNAPALAIWEACDGATTGREMAGALAELTGRSEEHALDEVEATIGTLLDQGLIEIADG